MIPALPYPLALTCVGLAGLAAHETTHYLAARAAGSPARFDYMWGAILPSPAVRVEPLALTPTTYRVVCLAPLVVFLPLVGAGLALDPTGPALGLWVMGGLMLVPSPPDWRQAYHAGDVAVLQRAAAGPHPSHQLAEGIAS